MIAALSGEKERGSSIKRTIGQFYEKLQEGVKTTIDLANHVTNQLSIDPQLQRQSSGRSLGRQRSHSNKPLSRYISTKTQAS